MSLKNKAMKAARILAGNAVSPEHHANVANMIAREAQALSMADGMHYTPTHISNKFTKDELRVMPDTVVPWCRLRIGDTVVLMGLSHANRDMMASEGQDVEFDFRGPDAPNAVILAYYEDGSYFPSSDDVMIVATDAAPSTLLDQRGMESAMRGGLLDQLVRLLIKHGRME